MARNSDHESGQNHADDDGGELPTYQASEGSSRRRPQQDEESFSTAHNYGENEDDEAPRDRRASYAKQVQRACKTALQRVKQDNALANSTWAEPLTAAPSAISVMAFLLKTAADKKVAGLQMSSLSVLQDGVEVGRLPSKYFHTNLQHCSDVGRLAFLDAQKRMNKINAVARSMMEDGGSVSYIVELLEDLEDAKLNLKPELEEVRKSATDCRKECEDMKKKFEYWLLVILNLSGAVLDFSGEKILMAKEVGKQKEEAGVNVTIHADQAATAESKIGDMQKKLDRAIDRVSRAQDELDALHSLPPIREPSHYEDVHMAQSLAPMTSAPRIDRGWFADMGSSILGYNSKKYRAEDEAYEDQHRAKHERRQQQIIVEEKARRDAERKRAEAKLEDARQKEASLYSEIDKTMKDLSLNEDKLADAKANLARANADLKRLGNQELELNQIVEILQESTSSLGMLKEQIEPLILFFSSLETTISVDVMKHVDAFLGTIERNVKVDDNNPNKVLSINLRGPSKKRVLDAVFQIQGRFSIISDISAAYIKISNNCIREAINRMERLSKVPDSEWDREREVFDQWCQGAIDDIHNISKETSERMGETMRKRIGMLETKAIEAAEEADNQ